MATRTSIRSTLRHPAVWLGLMGSFTIGVGELSRLTSWRRVGAPRGASVRQLDQAWWTDAITRLAPSDEAWVWVLVGVILLSLAWWWLRPPARGNLRLGLVFTWWVAPLLLLPPMFSTDAGSYADLGWTINQGLSPYVQGLGTTGGAFPYGTAWQGTTSVYPPGSLMLFAAITQVTGNHWYWSVVALRVLALLGAAGLAWALPRLAHRAGVCPRQALWLGLLNPVTITHGVGGEHIDLLMAGLVAVALVVAMRPGVVLKTGVLGAVVLGVAVAVKQPALMALPTLGVLSVSKARVANTRVAKRGTTPGWRRVVVSGIVAAGVVAATFAVITWASGLGYGWTSGTGTPTRSRQTLTLAYLLSQVGPEVGTWNTVLAWAGAGVVLALAILLVRQRPLAFLGYAALTYLLCFSVMREWYAIVVLAFIALARPPAWAITAAAVLATSLAIYGDLNEYHRLGGLTANAKAALFLAVMVAVVGTVLAMVQRRAPGGRLSWIGVTSYPHARGRLSAASPRPHQRHAGGDQPRPHQPRGGDQPVVPGGLQRRVARTHRLRPPV